MSDGHSHYLLHPHLHWRGLRTVHPGGKRMIYLEGDFESIAAELHHKLMEEAPQVDTGHWQSLKDVPHTATRELFRVCVETAIPVEPERARWIIDPNLPWAEDHFQERVAGKATNPGEQYMNWPWYSPSWEAQKGEALTFSHTYQERMWPTNMPGIRYRYGDLADLIALLAREPTTRQAYLPIWFPEDTGAHHKERVPCSLGYLFNLRGGLLHCTYYIRSCDFLRYFRDDVYMAMRLCQHVLERLCRDGTTTWDWADVQPGILQMNIGSLHIFEGDMPKMRREAPPTP